LAKAGHEQCDDGVDATTGACPNCQNAYCGDGYVETGVEQCDEGAMPDPHGACPSMCMSAYCGDGYVWSDEGGTEQCDDGTNALTGACPLCQNAVCGDGYVEAGVEECDDGSTNGTDGNCNTDCTCVSGATSC